MRPAEPPAIQCVQPNPWVSSADETPVLYYSQVFPGQADQVRVIRATLAQALTDCPMAADAVLAASELAANAVLHSLSQEPGGKFTVRAEIHPGDYLWLEVEDGGGPWDEQPRTDGRGHGFKIVAALSSDWGVEGDDLAQVVWVRFDWPGLTETDAQASPGGADRVGIT
jgi:anti-sigma regulatory factor (Ser/Thr protein kinase)